MATGLGELEVALRIVVIRRFIPIKLEAWACLKIDSGRKFHCVSTRIESVENAWDIRDSPRDRLIAPEIQPMTQGRLRRRVPIPNGEDVELTCLSNVS